MSLYGSAISMTEGTRFDTVFRWHLQAKVMMDFVVTVCFVRWFPVSVVCAFMYCPCVGRFVGSSNRVGSTECLCSAI
jgi:hypothetical protein